jgi:hypothetical protein
VWKTGENRHYHHAHVDSRLDAASTWRGYKPEIPRLTQAISVVRRCKTLAPQIDVATDKSRISATFPLPIRANCRSWVKGGMIGVLTRWKPGSEGDDMATRGNHPEPH